MEPPPSTSTGTKRSFRLRYSLRGLMIVVTLTACACGWGAWQRRLFLQEKKSAEILEGRYHATVSADFKKDGIQGGIHPYISFYELQYGRIYRPVEYVRLQSSLGQQELRNLKHLREIHASAKPATIESISKLQLSELRVLRISGSGLSSDEMPDFSGLEQITELYVSSVQVHEAGSEASWAEAIAPLHALRVLELQNMTISQRACAVFGEIKNLKSLSFINCELHAPDLVSLKQLEHLKQLNLQATPISETCLRDVLSMERLTSGAIDLRKIDDPDFCSISKLTELENLSLSGITIRDDDIVHVMKLPKLRRLKLVGAQLTSPAIQSLSKIPNLVLEDVRLLPQ